MYRKLNIKLLAIVFAVLLVITVIVKISDSRSGDRTLKSVLVEFNSDDVTTIKLYPKALNGGQLTFEKQTDGWIVSDGESKYRADSATIQGIVKQFEKLEPIRMAATKQERWSSFEVTDSLASRIVFENEGDVLGEVYVGKFSYRQPKNNMQQYNPYGRPQGTMNTYVRIADEDEVYAVDGFLGMSLNRQLNDFRDRTVINSNTAQWSKMVFSYPADSSFTLIKQEGKWMVDGVLADSASVADYLKPLGRLQSSLFMDKMVGGVSHSVRVEGVGIIPFEVTASVGAGVSFASSLNPGTFFSESIDGNVMQKLFVGKGMFLK
ncbi:MAG: DUF4340 domain-containing protein [Marinilabiliaceae bacterium]|nr:DUF4340 domain-containing protein [Marinilabiliaceae bacterium]